MNFDISENSHDVLSENFVKKSIISEQKLEQEVEGTGEPNWEWIEREIEKGGVTTELNPGCFSVGSADNRIKGFFKAKVTEGSTAVDTFVEVLMDKIKTTPEAKKYIGTGGKFVIESMDIIAGASNSLNGSMTPTMDNNYKPLNITKGSPEDLKYDHPIDSETYDKNMGYAKGRGEGVRDGLIKAFNSDKIKGFKMNSENITISNYIIDTGGKIDIESTSENKGQVALVWMKVCWVNTETTIKEPIVEQLKRCMGDLSVQVNYYKGKNHHCNHAAFKIFVNNIPLKRTGFGLDTETVTNNASEYADLNNGVDADGAVGNRDDGSAGGTRVNEFKLGGEGLGQLVTIKNLKQFKGGVQVQAECADMSDIVTDLNWSDNRQLLYSFNNETIPPTFINNANEKKTMYNSEAGTISKSVLLMYLRVKYKVETNVELSEKLEIESSSSFNKMFDTISSNGMLTSKANPKLSMRKNKKLMNGNRVKTAFGCHKGVAVIKVLHNGKEVDVNENVSTPRYADGNIYTLGPEMEACNALWSKVVEDSKNQS